MKIINVTDQDIRLDKFLASELNISRSKVNVYLEKELVKVNGKIRKPSFILHEDDEIMVTELEEEEYHIKPVNLNLNILYSDADIAIVYKPKGMVTHPAPGQYENTMVHSLLYQIKDLSGINGVLRPGIVHRIDKDTSGILLVAKNDFAHNLLSEQLQAHSINRLYYALVYGTFNHETGRINAPIGRDTKDRKKMAVIENGKEAITNFRVLETFKDFSLIECKLETGRTHQIRVHMAYIGHPVVGDPVYGPNKVIGKTGQYLHAKTLGFIHPRTQQYMEFDSDLDPSFVEKLEELRASK